jgi:spermidine synthase
MQPLLTIDRARMSDGAEFALLQRGEEWIVQVNERILMSSRMHDSEEDLATCVLERMPEARSVFVGGLGLGYTLRAALDCVGADAKVSVAELVPALVEWNREHLGPLANHPLRDPRCDVIVGDALDALGKLPGNFDAILLDIDNGPSALSNARNQRVYAERGLRQCLRSLRPGGVLAIWSAAPSPSFEARLNKVAGNVEVLMVAARKGNGAKHFIFIANKVEPVS